MLGLLRRMLSSSPLATELTRQLGEPRGFLGYVTGAMLARDNAELTRWVIGQLDPSPAHAVLEIGCGAAAAVDDVLRRCGGGGYDGIDPSVSMLRQARFRNRHAVEAGRARFHLAAADDLPFPDDRFDAAFGVNVIYFWDDPAAELAEIRRVLVPGARLAIGIRPATAIPDEFREQFEGVGHRTYSPHEVRTSLQDAGFTQVDVAVAEDGYAAILGSA